MLPTIMSESPIGLSHAMGVFLFLNRRAAVVRGINNLRRQLLFHRFFRAFTRRVDKPAHAQREPPLGPHFDGYLIGCAADPARTHFNSRTGVLDGAFKNTERLFFGFCRDNIHRSIKNRFGGALLALIHDRVDKLRDHLIAELWVRQNITFSYFTFARHNVLPWTFRAVLGTALSPFLHSD